MGKLIDLREELRMRLLARHLVEDLCMSEEAVEDVGGPVEFAKILMAQVDALPEGNSETILEDHPELFEMLRKRATG
tara:strand:- start:4414 stop:4644 length:231 start_codon:yes stop_codon:yes gene_type:complete